MSNVRASLLKWYLHAHVVSSGCCLTHHSSCSRSLPWGLNVLCGKLIAVYFLYEAENTKKLLHYFHFWTYFQERMSLPKSLRALKDLVDSKTLDINDQEVPMGITGLEAFSLSYKVILSNWLLKSYFVFIIFHFISKVILSVYGIDGLNIRLGNLTLYYLS